MLLSSQLVLDSFVGFETVEGSSDTWAALSAGDELSIQVRTSQALTGSVMTVLVETSTDGSNWKLAAQPWTTTPVATGENKEFFATVAGPFGSFTRIRVRNDDSTSGYRVQVFASVRGESTLVMDAVRLFESGVAGAAVRSSSASTWELLAEAEQVFLQLDVTMINIADTLTTTLQTSNDGVGWRDVQSTGVPLVANTYVKSHIVLGGLALGRYARVTVNLGNSSAFCHVLITACARTRLRARHVAAAGGPEREPCGGGAQCSCASTSDGGCSCGARP